MIGSGIFPELFGKFACPQSDLLQVARLDPLIRIAHAEPAKIKTAAAGRDGTDGRSGSPDRVDIDRPRSWQRG
jgi:hypothetical protein